MQIQFVERASSKYAVAPFDVSERNHKKDCVYEK